MKPINVSPLMHTVHKDDEDYRVKVSFKTWHSHNQKIVSNENGIFLTHLQNRTQDTYYNNDGQIRHYETNHWRLIQSKDHGKTWSTLLQQIETTRPPVLETDQDGNLYLISSCNFGRKAVLRILAKGGIDKMQEYGISEGSHDKFSMVLDRVNNVIYYAHRDNGQDQIHHQLHRIDLKKLPKKQLELCGEGYDCVKNGTSGAYFHFPLVDVDAKDRTLFLGWTSEISEDKTDPSKTIPKRYNNICLMKKRETDTGIWRRMDEKPITTHPMSPVSADEQSDADHVTSKDEVGKHCFLNSLLFNDGRLHLSYSVAMTVPQRECYVMYDLQRSGKELRVSQFRGENLWLASCDSGAFFASSRREENAMKAPLYLVSNARVGSSDSSDVRLACWRSDDNGTTWHDHALADGSFDGGDAFRGHEIGGCREVTSDGKIIGFCARKASRCGKCDHNHVDHPGVYFFSIEV